MFYCISYSLIFRDYGKKPWTIYTHVEDANRSSSSSDSKEFESVVYDPDNLHWRSSSLSTYLDECKKDGWLPTTQKPRSHSWYWTSDEETEEETYEEHSRELTE
jgi:hypothetical protein